MSKKHKSRPVQQSVQLPKKDNIAHWYRQCPHCYSGDGGLGSEYGRSGKKTGNMNQIIYYRCTTCGWTWTIRRGLLESRPLTNMSPPPIRHADVPLNARDSDGLKSRDSER